MRPTRGQSGPLASFGVLAWLDSAVSVDVAAAGAANAAAYGTRAAAQLSNHPQLAKLSALFADALPSTNTFSDKIQLYDAAGAVLDTRSVYVASYGVAGIAEFERQQGPSWLPRRQGFEDLWDAGRTFVYAVANPGHTGLQSYGPFCIVIDADRVRGSSSAVFPGNTAQLYGRETGPPDAAAAHAAAGCWAFVDDVGVAVFGDDAAGEPPAQWAELVCNEDRFLEVVAAGPVVLADIVEVRLSAATRADLNAWTILERRGALADTSKRNAVAAWRTVKRWVNSTYPHIQLRIV
jgi:hypothetical protein